MKAELKKTAILGVLWSWVSVCALATGVAPAQAHVSVPPAPQGRVLEGGAVLPSAAVQQALAQAGLAGDAAGEGGFMARSASVTGLPLVRLAQWGGQRSPIETFFSTLFGGVQRPPAETRPRVLITPGATPQGTPGARREDGGSARSGGSSGGASAFCVRTCDGRYFPLGARVSSSSRGAAEAACAAMCPAANTELFTGSTDIDRTVNRRGVSYASLPAAYVFRKRLVEGCSCNGTNAAGGLKYVDIMDDPTLQKGDVVMTKEGPRVFRGAGGRPPYRDTDFVKPSKFPKLSSDMRRRLKELTVASR